MCGRIKRIMSVIMFHAVFLRKMFLKFISFMVQKKKGKKFYVVYRSAVNGHYVSKQYAQRYPHKTVAEKRYF